MKASFFVTAFREPAMSIAALAGVASIPFLISANPVAAATKGGGGSQPDNCSIDSAVCYKSCKGELDWCFKDCDLKMIQCKPDKAQSGSGPVSPKTGAHTSPTGGTKNEPKAPPKVNDTRPPMGGGVFQPRASGGGNDGPILHSGGSPGPILKSNSGNDGPSFRSGGRN